jgi:glycosyltransferase involved in cell wall biosynthesis
MHLSVCLIARNEERNLPRALQSVAGIADEVIVSDTGSSDSTPDIALQFHARLLHFPWIDDFSAARNFAISHAQGQWIFWLDADEELLLSSRDELIQCTNQRDLLACFVRRQDLVKEGEPDFYTEMWQLRLFRNLPELRFRGRCHPEFDPPIHEVAARNGLQVSASAITLRHYGYVGELKDTKLRRAAHLLSLELGEKPGQLYYMIEYGRTLLRLDDPRGHEILMDVAQQIVSHLDDDRAPIPMIAALFEYLMQLPEDRFPAGLTKDQVFSAAWKWFPKAPPLLWLIGRRQYEVGRFDKAEKTMRLLIAMGRNHSYDHSISFDPAIVGEDAVLNLGACLFRQRRLQEAQKCFRGLLGSKTRAQEAKSNLKAIKMVNR